VTSSKDECQSILTRVDLERVDGALDFSTMAFPSPNRALGSPIFILSDALPLLLGCNKIK